MAVTIHEHTYTRYSDSSDLKYANIVSSHTILNTTDPTMTMMVGIILFPRPLAAAAALSINADTQ